MAAVGIYRAVRVSFTCPPDRDLDHVEIWAATVNDRALATLVGMPKATPSAQQTWLHSNLAPGDMRWYWCRALDRSSNASTFFPVSATGGWAATVTGIPVGDLPGGMGAPVVVTSSPQALAVNTRYIIDMATLCSLDLPATAALGDAFWIRGKGAGLFRITQGAGQSIWVGRAQTTVGVTGALQSRYAHSTVTLECITADLEFTVVAFS